MSTFRNPLVEAFHNAYSWCCRSFPRFYRRRLKPVGHVIVWIVLSPLVLYFYLELHFKNRKQRKEIEAKAKTAQFLLSTPRRPERPRSLTIPAANGQRNADQSQSLFFTILPAEIRIYIYELVLRDTGFQVWAESRAGRPPKVHLRGSRCLDLGHSSVLPDFRRGCEGHPRCFPANLEARLSFLNMPLACTKMYYESIGVLYASSAFRIPGVVSFLWFAALIQPPRMDTIRNLEFYYLLPALPAFVMRLEKPGYRVEPKSINDWNYVWSLISSMKGLQNLHVELEVDQDSNEEWLVHENAILKPVRQVNIPSRFKLVLPFDGDLTLDMRPSSCQLLPPWNSRWRP